MRTQRYLGALTAFGTVIAIENRLYNAAVTVEAKDGSTRDYRLPFLIAHGITLKETPCPQLLDPLSSPCAPDPQHPGNDDPTTFCS